MTMKFVLAPVMRYWWPVTVRLPDPGQPGKLLEMQLKVLFEVKDQDASIKDQKRVNDIADPFERIVAERHLLAEHVKDWGDVVDPDHTAVPCNPANLDAALQQSWFRTGLYRALSESLNGQEAASGN